MLFYDVASGVLTWTKRPSNRVCVGEEAGYLRDDGYRGVCIAYGRVLAHRLIWKYVTGDWPPEMIDHRDGNRSNNRLDNLRLSSLAFNNQNLQVAKKHSKSGVLGVCWHAQRNKWVANIRKDGKTTYLGLFEDINDAHQAYLSAKRLFHAGNTL